MSSPILQIEHVRCIKGNIPVVDDVSLTIFPGTILAIVGPSGAGKTTLLRTLNLLETPHEGALTVAGVCVTDKVRSTGNKPGSLRWLRQQVGMVFQDLGLWPHMSVQDNLVEAPVCVKRMTKSDAIKKALTYTTQLGIANKLQAFPDQLSGGQQQRVALIRALMMDPQILLIDEGTSALDPEWTQGIGRFIQELAAGGMAIVVVTHDMDFARQIATHVIFMDHGKIQLQGSPQALFDKNQPHKRWARFVKEEFAHA